MKILLLASLKPFTGNLTSAERIRDHLETGGHSVLMQQVSALKNASDLETILQQKQIDLAIGIHAHRSGEFLKDVSTPYVLVLTGPDIDLADDPDKMTVMTEAMARATLVTSYGAYFADHAKEVWPEYSDKITWTPKAVTVEASAFSLRQELELPEDAILLLHVNGIRPVKDNAFLFEDLQKWHQEDKRIHTVLIGRVLDEQYAKEVFAKIDAVPSVSFRGPIARSDLHAAMREANAVLNTAKSEGMPNSLLEAMALGTPVIARNIPGNACIITDNETGLLYDSPEEFQEKAQRLIDSPNLQERLTRAASAFIAQQHTLDQEREGWLKTALKTVPGTVHESEIIA